MADKRDYYEVLGIQKNATDDEIKKAYRTLAKMYHPDLHPDDKKCEEKFKEATEAFEVLSDKTKRAKYDQFGHAGVDPQYGAGGMGGFNGTYSGGFSDMNDVFENFFGGIFGGGSSSQRNSSSSANAPRKGQDINANISISFMEACMGKKQDVKINRMDQCDTCHGSGASTGTSSQICPECNGTGNVKVTQRTAFGIISTQRICSKCQGKGKIITNPCPDCKGLGRKRVQKTINIDIPAGIDNGQALRISNQGDAGVNGGPAGNLNVGITVRPDPIFTRKGYDVYCEIPITYYQAVMGDKIIVPTIDGKVEYTVGEGTQTGTTFRLRSKGIKRINSTVRGDQYVRVNVEVPKSLSKRQKDLLQEFENSLGEKNYNKRQGFFDKLKEKFS